MKEIRFFVFAIVSFLAVLISSVFSPGAFLSRVFSMVLCTVFSFNSTFCVASLFSSSERANATSSSSIERPRDTYTDLPKQESMEIEKRRILLAFESFNKEAEGHRGITEQALKDSWTVAGQTLNFTPEAIREIERANRSVDLKPEFLDSESATGLLWNTVKHTELPFSKDFDIHTNHFDNESFKSASQRLQTLKKDAVDLLKQITTDSSENYKTTQGKEAQKNLGQALHTLQDFYSHTNWVELGFDTIDTRLGREIISDPSPNRYTSEPVSQGEIATAQLAQAALLVGNRIPTGAYGKIALEIGAAVLLSHTPEELASSQSTKPGILKSEFKGKRNKDLLTSGYFMGLGVIDSCRVPTGKTRHGSSVFLCPHGLNKDEPGRGYDYDVAFRLAFAASKDYINQIIFEDPNINSNIDAIKALMGIKDPPKEEPCKSKENQNREECKHKGGVSTGDPHLATFDGLRYDLQTVGEFILVKSNDGTFEVQARQVPINSYLSLNSAVAMKVGSDRIAFYSKDFPDADTNNPLRVNGKPAIIQGDKLALTGGGEILKQGSTYVINSPRGEKVLVSLAGAGNNLFFNVSPFVYNRSDKYSGLLGNVNGNKNDDFQIRGGSNVLEVQSTYGDVTKVLNLVGLRLPGALDRAEKVYFDQLYKQFGNSWRVKQEESLFDYPAGKTTKSYVDPGFPDKYLTLNMLSPEQIQKARNACTQASVSPDLMEGCIFDVGFSGFSEFARTTAEISSYINIVNQLIPGLNIPTPEQAVQRGIELIKPKVCLPIIGCS